MSAAASAATRSARRPSTPPRCASASPAPAIPKPRTAPSWRANRWAASPPPRRSQPWCSSSPRTNPASPPASPTSSTAAGRIEAGAMPLNFLSLLTGCFAYPAAENPTVAMVEAAYRHHGLDARYINCEVPAEKLGDAVRGARAMGWAGFNCSLPHKVAVIDHLDGLGQSAEIMGAVNCAVRRGERFIGENTDGKGFLSSLEGVVEPRGKRVVMFGAGGAGRPLRVELALAGACSISVVNRSPERGAELVGVINDKTHAKAE